MQTVELSKEVVVNTQTLQTSKSEITALRSRLQALEIELQSQQSLVKDECRLSFFFIPFGPHHLQYAIFKVLKKGQFTY